MQTKADKGAITTTCDRSRRTPLSASNPFFFPLLSWASDSSAYPQSNKGRKQTLWDEWKNIVPFKIYYSYCAFLVKDVKYSKQSFFLLPFCVHRKKTFVYVCICVSFSKDSLLHAYTHAHTHAFMLDEEELENCVLKRITTGLHYQDNNTFFKCVLCLSLSVAL